MIKKSELQTITIVAGLVDAAIGPAIPLNHRRYVYSVKGVNQFAGANVLTVGARENGAGATVALWYLSGVLAGDVDQDPDDELTENAVPLFSVGGAGAAGASTARVVTSAGNMLVAMRYVDSIGD